MGVKLEVTDQIVLSFNSTLKKPSQELIDSIYYRIFNLTALQANDGDEKFFGNYTGNINVSQSLNYLAFEWSCEYSDDFTIVINLNFKDRPSLS